MQCYNCLFLCEHIDDNDSTMIPGKPKVILPPCLCCLHFLCLFALAFALKFISKIDNSLLDKVDQVENKKKNLVNYKSNSFWLKKTKFIVITTCRLFVSSISLAFILLLFLFIYCDPSHSSASLYRPTKVLSSCTNSDNIIMSSWLFSFLFSFSFSFYLSILHSHFDLSK
jgi:hypothetical protein